MEMEIDPIQRAEIPQSDRTHEFSNRSREPSTDHLITKKSLIFWTSALSRTS